MDFPIFPTTVRLAVPLLILRFPLLGIILSSFADMYDWFFIDTTSPTKLAFYQKLDKGLDIYYQLIIFYLVFKFKDTLVKRTAIFLFIFRYIGLFLFYTVGSRQFLFYFPNVFDNFVIAYLIFAWVTKKKVKVTSKRHIFWAVAIIAVPKLVHEYFQHFLLRMPWEVYDIGGYLSLTGIYKDYANYITYGLLLHLIPILIAVYVLKGSKKK
jgi:hypothetical protein